MTARDRRVIAAAIVAVARSGVSFRAYREQHGIPETVHFLPTKRRDVEWESGSSGNVELHWSRWGYQVIPFVIDARGVVFDFEMQTWSACSTRERARLLDRLERDASGPPRGVA